MAKYPKMYRVHNQKVNIYLTHHLGFVVYINATHMSFSCSSRSPLFIATINNHNVVFLDGMTQCVTQYAQAATTLPLDLVLWHH